jgi:L-fucose mutarotase
VNRSDPSTAQGPKHGPSARFKDLLLPLAQSPVSGTESPAESSTRPRPQSSRVAARLNCAGLRYGPSAGFRDSLSSLIQSPVSGAESDEGKCSLLPLQAFAVKMTILKRVPRIINPQLLYTLARMGHGDVLVVADANFPAASVAASTPGGLIHCDGSNGPELMAAILELMPLDETCSPVGFMELSRDHQAMGWTTPIKKIYKEIADKAEGRDVPCEEIERFAFYERAKKAFAVVSTGEQALYANVMLKKGVIGSTGK